jgi:hypothetical protein
MNSSHDRRQGCLPAFGMCLLLAGCGPTGPVRFEVSGEVTFRGQPVPAGMIYFTPDAPKGNQGPQAYAPIRQGKYDTRHGGKGTVGGPVTVRIEGFDGKGEVPGAVGNPLFVAYEIPAELPHSDTTQTFDVPVSAAEHLPAARSGRRP